MSPITRLLPHRVQAALVLGEPRDPPHQISLRPPTPFTLALYPAALEHFFPNVISAKERSSEFNRLTRPHHHGLFAAGSGRA